MRGQYARTPPDARRALFRDVRDHHLSIRAAAARLHIKYSTAKTMLGSNRLEPQRRGGSRARKVTPAILAAVVALRADPRLSLSEIAARVRAQFGVALTRGRIWQLTRGAARDRDFQAQTEAAPAGAPACTDNVGKQVAAPGEPRFDCVCSDFSAQCDSFCTDAWTQVGF